MDVTHITQNGNNMEQEYHIIISEHSLRHPDNRKTRIEKIILRTQTACNYSDHFMVPKGIKVSKVIQRRSRAKVVEWEI
jgi:hypothetical protein